jgi:hypothetical protein
MNYVQITYSYICITDRQLVLMISQYRHPALDMYCIYITNILHTDYIHNLNTDYKQITFDIWITF